MKVGDTVPVNIGAHVVAQATVKELSDGTATLVVPATLVVMATRTTLDDAPEPVAPERETETVITGVERAGSETEESATANTPTDNSNNAENNNAASGGSVEDVSENVETPDVDNVSSNPGADVEASTNQPVANGGSEVPTPGSDAGDANSTQTQASEGV